MNLQGENISHGKDQAYPICLIHTQAGSVPHLTNETLSYINTELIENGIYQVPCSGLINYEDTFKQFRYSCTEFFSLPVPSLTYLSVQDLTEPTPKGFNTCKTVAVMACAQRIDLWPEKYMEFVEALKPDIFELLVDSDVLPTDGRKRNTKSVDRSLYCIEKCLDFYKKSDALKNKSKIMCGVVAGSKFLERLRFCELAYKKVHKFEKYIWGFCIHSLPQEINVSDETKNLLQMIKTELSGEKALYIPAVSHPLTVIDYMIEGVSIFDTSSITSKSNKMQALVYRYPDNFAKAFLSNGDQKYSLIDEAEQCDVSNFQETINLANPQYAKVFQPILPGCTCYTCQNFTCAYIHHLTVVKEMQCYVLLMLHNLHHHFSFFREAKHCFRSVSDLGRLRNKIVELNKN